MCLPKWGTEPRIFCSAGRFIKICTITSSFYSVCYEFGLFFRKCKKKKRIQFMNEIYYSISWRPRTHRLRTFDLNQSELKVLPTDRNRGHIFLVNEISETLSTLWELQPFLSFSENLKNIWPFSDNVNRIHAIHVNHICPLNMNHIWPLNVNHICHCLSQL